MENIATIHDTLSKQVKIDGEHFFLITDSDRLRPFFMNVVSDSNHWLFISSNGGLTAGRKNADYALFPYYTEDKITNSAETTGSKSIFWVHRADKKHLWEPFSDRQYGLYNISRNLYKSVYGNKVRFEEINHDLGVRFCYQWSSSDKYGFVRKSILQNQSSGALNISLLDGLQNVLPNSVPSDLQNSTSNLVDAYKRNQLDKDSGLGIYALSAIIVDKAEPSESLKANTVCSFGLKDPVYLLSSLQLNDFRKGLALNEEVDIKAERGAYFVHTEIALSPGVSKEWSILADVNKDHRAIVQCIETLKHDKNLANDVDDDIKIGTKRLIKFIASADGLQLSADFYRDARHFSNVLFNVMRGGIFDNNYQIEKIDFCNYIHKANKQLFTKHQDIFDALNDTFSHNDLDQIIHNSKDVDLRRLVIEYMPLKFSRRHGDPSRPWNKFSINTRSEVDGTKILDYEGNWRDIFQNWEALVHAYPSFIESMIYKFLNASTFEGYNPYRVTKDGFDWETIEPDDPWSYIGYWGDHQVIYLLKFLEFMENHFPEKLTALLDEEFFVYANVPYKIKTYQEILKHPKDTIQFDQKSDDAIRSMKTKLGADGALLKNEKGAIYHVNFMEKILAIVLSKLSNFIPEGGIWMNTQRPEWNDANNALVGNGVSMVTLCYLRRFLKFFQGVLSNTGQERIQLSNELVDFYRQVRNTFDQNKALLSARINDKQRKEILDQLGTAGSDYRSHVYQKGFWGKKRSVTIEGLLEFIELSIQYLDHSIRANKRSDGLYHSYNLMSHSSKDSVSISNLSEMLEGQVAVLSSGSLTSEQDLKVLDGLKKSALFRVDQYSYLLYPEKELPGFLEKNTLEYSSIEHSTLLISLLEVGDTSIINQDQKGAIHFNGNFRNASDLKIALSALANSPFKDLVKKEGSMILDLYEQEFDHKSFTGRSGTFYGYEGLGSIYWHMVSKLLLATQESCLRAIKNNADASLIGRMLEHYYEIYAGIGVHKSPELYGAFSTDPYSHTPKGKGAQQPGMTGQVKEDILSRFGELGVFVENGLIHFNPCLLRKSEFLLEDKIHRYFNVSQERKELSISKNSLCFTYCQVPVIYHLGNAERITVVHVNQKQETYNTLSLNHEISQEIFNRTGKIEKLVVELIIEKLK